MQATGTDGGSGNFFQGFAADTAIVGEKDGNQAAKALLRQAEDYLRQELPASGTREQATRENPPPANTFSLQQSSKQMKLRVFDADICWMTKRVAVVLFACAAYAAAQDASQLVGRWRSVETSKGGIGAMYDFLADGTARFSPGAIVPFQYHVEGDRLSFFPSDGISYTLTYTDDDRMRMTVNGASEDYTRLGPVRDPQNKLLGEWTGTRDMDGQKVLVHWIFGPDSRALLMIRFLTESGSFVVQNGHLTASFGGKPGIDGPISIADGVLTINRSGGRVTRLQRY